jgi:hypothetical protein
MSVRFFDRSTASDVNVASYPSSQNWPMERRGLLFMVGKTCARRASVESGGRMPLFGSSAVCVAVMESPLGRPTLYLAVTGRLSTQGVSGSIKCLEQPVSAIPLDAVVGTREKALKAKIFELLWLVPCGCQGLLAVDPPMVSAAFAHF